MVGGVADSVVDDAKLRAELARRSRTVDRAQRVLPETPANGQQRVVGDEIGLVVRARSDPGAAQMTIDLPGARLKRGLDVVPPIGALGQNDPADHGLDVIVRELDIDREPALEALQGRCAGQRRLAGSHEEQAVAEALAASFHDLLDDVRAAGVAADVLLHLVEDDDRARNPAARSERILQCVNELVRRDVVGLRKLGAEGRPRFSLAGRESRVHGEKRPRDDGAHIEVAQLTPKAPSRRLDLGAKLVVDAVPLEPQGKTRLREPLGESGRLEHDAQQGEPDAASRRRTERPRGSVEPIPSPAEGRELSEQLRNVEWQPREAASAGTVFRERVVHPQEAQHFRKVRLAAAEEAADPRGRLLGLTLAAEVGLEDADESASILAFADEVLELEAKGAAFVVRCRVGHGRDTVVEERDSVGVPLVDLPVPHTPYTPRSSRTVIGTAR